MNQKNKKLGTGYSYLLVILGCVMLITASIGLDFVFENGKTQIRLKTQQVPLHLLSVYTTLIATGLGVRLTIPGVVGAALPSSQAVEELGEKLTGGS